MCSLVKGVTKLTEITKMWQPGKNAFEIARPKAELVKGSGVIMKPGQRLNISGHIVNDEAVARLSRFNIPAPTTLIEKIDMDLKNSQFNCMNTIKRRMGIK